MKIICFVLLLTSYSLASHQELNILEQTNDSYKLQLSSLQEEVIRSLRKPFQWALSYFTKQENPKVELGEPEEIV